MKIFLDVGGNVGQSVAEILRPIYRFDVIHSFEPQRICYQEMKGRFSSDLGEKVVLHNFGLADFNGERNLFGSGEGASMFVDKRDIDNRQIAMCRFVRASKFIAENINDGDYVVMKINCEGGELPVVRDLIQSQKIHKLQAMFIDFDIRKIPSLADQQSQLISELNSAGFFGYRTQYDLRRWYFTTSERTNHWLSTVDGAESIMTLTAWQKFARRLPFHLRQHLQRRIRDVRKKFYQARGGFPSD